MRGLLFIALLLLSAMNTGPQVMNLDNMECNLDEVSVWTHCCECVGRVWVCASTIFNDIATQAVPGVDLPFSERDHAAHTDHNSIQITITLTRIALIT
jgi:hypothetical protein